MPIESAARRAVLDAVADQLMANQLTRPLRVGVDGVDGSGKTSFADELAANLRERGRSVVRASVDGFHNPRAVRYARGRTSPEGFYRDSYDYDLMRALLLDPMRPGGSGAVQLAAFAVESDEPVESAVEQLTANSIVIVDGIFLHRPEVRENWDVSFFLRVEFEVSIGRCATRDGTPEGANDPRNARYVEGQRIYFAEVMPESQATIIIDNNDLAAPFIVTG